MTALAFPRSALRALFTRAVGLWVAVRLMIAAILMLAARSAPLETVSGPSPIAILFFCTLLGVIDIRRRREVALWRNLGISTAQLVLLFAVVAVMGELVIAAVRS